MSFFTKEIKNRMLMPYKMVNQISVGEGDGMTNPISKNLAFNNPILSDIENSVATVFDIPALSTINRIEIRNNGRVFDPNERQSSTSSTIYFNNYADLFATRPTSNTQTAGYGRKLAGLTCYFVLHEMQPQQIPDNVIEAPTVNVVIIGGDYQNNMDVIYETVKSNVEYYTETNTDCYIKVGVEDELGQGGGTVYFLATAPYGRDSYKVGGNGTFSCLYNTSDYVEPMVFNEDSQISISKVKIELNEVEL